MEQWTDQLGLPVFERGLVPEHIERPKRCGALCRFKCKAQTLGFQNALNTALSGLSKGGATTIVVNGTLFAINTYSRGVKKQQFVSVSEGVARSGINVADQVYSIHCPTGDNSFRHL